MKTLPFFVWCPATWFPVGRNPPPYSKRLPPRTRSGHRNSASSTATRHTPTIAPLEQTFSFGAVRPIDPVACPVASWVEPTEPAAFCGRMAHRRW